MKEMSLRQFAAHLSSEAAAMPARQRVGLVAGGAIVEAEAKAEIGHYQGPAGPFSAWEALKDSTVHDRVSKGYSGNQPLLREGDMRISIHHRADSDEMVVGSDENIALYQEMGTRRIPPRSFLGGAMVRKTDEVVAVVVDRMLGPLGQG